MKVVNFVSDEDNPQFRCGRVPYAWSWLVNDESVGECIKQAQERWPDVHISVKEWSLELEK